MPSIFGPVRPLREEDVRTDFRTVREPKLAEFFRNSSWTAEQAGASRTFVLDGTAGSPLILGYYTLSMSKLHASVLPAPDPSFPFGTLPVVRLGNLARDTRAPKGTGVRLMGDAFRRILAAAEDVGCFCIILSAKDPGLEKYYDETYGFENLKIPKTTKDPDQQMYLPLSDVRARLATPATR